MEKGYLSPPPVPPSLSRPRLSRLSNPCSEGGRKRREDIYKDGMLTERGRVLYFLPTCKGE